MYLLRAKEKVDKEARKKAREKRKRAREARKEKKKIDRYEALVEGWQDTTFNCGYLGSFEVAMEANSDRIDKDDVKDKLGLMQVLYGEAQPALMTVCLEGIEIFNQSTQAMSMAHTLSRISYMPLHPEEPIVGFVAKNPGNTVRFCHVFQLRKRKRAQQVHKRMRKAVRIFKMEYELGRGKGKGKKSKRASKGVCEMDGSESGGEGKHNTGASAAAAAAKKRSKHKAKASDKPGKKKSSKKATETPEEAQRRRECRRKAKAKAKREQERQERKARWEERKRLEQYDGGADDVVVAAE